MKKNWIEKLYDQVVELAEQGNVKPSIALSFPSSKGNKKLGKSLVTFSLPAMVTCPGAEECRRYCYVKRINLSAQIRYIKNLLFIKKYGVDRAATELSKQIKKAQDEGKLGWLRLHVSGDFFSHDYADMWIDLARKHRLLGAVYTRSLHLFPQLERLDKYIKVWISITWPKLESWVTRDLLHGRRIAVVLQNDGSRERLNRFLEELDPKNVVVFRTNRSKPEKSVGRWTVCPAENGASNLSCEQCWFCYSEYVAKRFAK